MAITNVTTAGTRVQLTATANAVASVTIQIKATNSAAGIIYIGLPVSLGPQNSENLVSSTVYDLWLSSTQPSVTIGLGVAVPYLANLSQIWLDASVSGEGVSWFTEQK